MSINPSVKKFSADQAIESLTLLEVQLINQFQGEFPVSHAPFKEVAEQLEVTEHEIMACIQSLLDRNVITRFGPLFDIEKRGGCFSLCALKVPTDRFDEVTSIVNQFDEVAHNYQRDNLWNMWFVLATERQDDLEYAFSRILAMTQCEGMNLPKEKEFFVGLYLEASEFAGEENQ